MGSVRRAPDSVWHGRCKLGSWSIIVNRHEKWSLECETAREATFLVVQIGSCVAEHHAGILSDAENVADYVAKGRTLSMLPRQRPYRRRDMSLRPAGERDAFYDVTVRP